MITRYDVMSSKWSSQFWVKIHVFQVLSTIKVNLVAKIMQSAYLGYFSFKAQKNTISRSFNLISNSW